MKKLLLIPLLVSSFAFAESDKFDFQGETVSHLLSLYFKEVSKQPYVMCDLVVNDTRLVNLRAEGKTLDKLMESGILTDYGFESRVDNLGVIHVCKKPDIPLPVIKKLSSFVYTPKYRDVSYLTDLLAPLVRGVFANRRVSSSSPTNVTSAAGQSASVAPQNQSTTSHVSSAYSSPDDVLIFEGENDEVEKLKAFLPQIDVRVPQVMVKAYLYDVGTSKTDASALSVMTNFLNGFITGGVGVAAGSSDFFKLSIGGIDAVVSALSQDSRFKVVATPFTLLRSGESARLQVGQDLQVPTEIVTSNGQSSQGFQFVSSGVIFDVKARVHGSITDIDLTQTVSDFVPVGKAYGLNKREHHTALSVTDGELVMIGGLMSNSV